MDEIVRGIEGALNIEYDPGLLERVRQRVVDGVRECCWWSRKMPEVRGYAGGSGTWGRIRHSR